MVKNYDILLSKIYYIDKFQIKTINIIENFQVNLLKRFLTRKKVKSKV